MSHYGEMYQAREDRCLVDKYCPSWANNESFKVRVAIAESCKAPADLDSLRRDLASLKRLVNG